MLLLDLLPLFSGVTLDLIGSSIPSAEAFGTATLITGDIPGTASEANTIGSQHGPALNRRIIGTRQPRVMGARGRAIR
jgi:hypothetical protein